mgnify:CR=1 FL=1
MECAPFCLLISKYCLLLETYKAFPPLLFWWLELIWKVCLGFGFPENDKLLVEGWKFVWLLIWKVCLGFVSPEKVLSSIALSGDYVTSFKTGNEFTFGGVVTANYDNGSTKVVTSEATFFGYDMSNAGTQQVTVSYTENDVTKEATYNITIVAPTLVDYELYSGDTLVEGDYIIYYPEEGMREMPIESGDETIVGCIFYYAEDLDISDYTYSKRHPAPLTHRML